ncbi:MAG TPA: hypothetical protein VJ921_08175 [Vicinamibacteria bacterium]|nr:hypothetical protein [Vicinamibacteria bacterium]
MTERPTHVDLREPALVFGAFLVASFLLPLLPNAALWQSTFGVAAVCGLAWSIARRKDSLAALGIRIDNFLPAAGMFLLVTAILAAPLYWLDRDLEIDPRNLLEYFFWATFQQFLVVAAFWRNFRGRAFPAALVFSLAHAPNLPLMALVLAAETVWLLLFNRFRNLFALALVHAGAALVAGQALVPEWLSSLRVGLHYLER